MAKSSFTLKRKKAPPGAFKNHYQIYENPIKGEKAVKTNKDSAQGGAAFGLPPAML